MKFMNHDTKKTIYKSIHEVPVMKILLPITNLNLLFLPSEKGNDPFPYRWLICQF